MNRVAIVKIVCLLLNELICKICDTNYQDTETEIEHTYLTVVCVVSRTGTKIPVTVVAVIFV